MVQASEVLTAGEADRISLVSARQMARHQDYLTTAERQLPMSTAERACEAAEKTPANGMTAGQVNPLAKIVNWLSYLGSRRADDSYLISRQSLPRNFGIGGFGL